LRAQIFSGLSNEFRRLPEKGPQFFLSGRIVRERSGQTQIRMVDRAIRVITTEMLQYIQPECFSLLRGESAMRQNQEPFLDFGLSSMQLFYLPLRPSAIEGFDDMIEITTFGNVPAGIEDRLRGFGVAFVRATRQDWTISELANDPRLCHENST
jgi:hypothetical protein